ncbi:hypothetical protein pipiens_006651 [Culex pipiens pipiens]|uniref:Ornithine decarboxylase n=1 Tax=Culex pipiens pipiens TaxID=38569 RepID=A0ABD1DP90_CULPP
MDHLLAELKNRLEIVPDSVTSKHLVDRLVALGPQEEPLHLIELDNLIKQHYAWLRHLPRVNPFYAIKSNDEPSIVATSVLLGIGYDCASKSELERVLAHGVNSEKIIFAQPAKTIDALKFARESKVRTVFDSEFELKKIQQYYPEAEYYCAATTTNVVSIHGKKILYNAEDPTQIEHIYYYLNDGISGTFYGVRSDNDPVNPIAWKEIKNSQPRYKTTFFGPTCDNGDRFGTGIELPELNICDSLAFPNHGAYTRVYATTFNGFCLPKAVVFIRQSSW